MIPHGKNEDSLYNKGEGSPSIVGYSNRIEVEAYKSR